MAFEGMHALLGRMFDTLFRSDAERLVIWLDQILLKNQTVSGHGDNSFIYNGEVYRLSTIKGVIPKPKVLHESLDAEMDAYLADKATVEEERHFLRQALVPVLDDCLTPQDIRDALPECLANCLPELVSQFKRTRPEAYTVENNPRGQRQYAKLAEKFELYAAMRLI